MLTFASASLGMPLCDAMHRVRDDVSSVLPFRSCISPGVVQHLVGDVEV